MTQNTTHAVMAQRSDRTPNALDFFPTPPWATRALCEWLVPERASPRSVVWEPACGEGHMSRTLDEYFGVIFASDAHDYGHGRVADFLFEDISGVDWIVTNPPFRLAAEFTLHALPRATCGVAMLCRSVFLEGGGRWRTLYDPHPPSDVLIFSERVPMLKGRVDRKASSATSYAWFVWRRFAERKTLLHWIPPGTRKRLEHPGDYDEHAVTGDAA